MDKAFLEQRTLQIRDVDTDDNSMKVSGYVNKNNSISEVLSEDGVVFRETILPQAFTNALASGNEICFYLEHDPNKILATTKNNTLEVTQDDVGLHMSATIVPTSDGNNAYKLIKSGIITNMSFGFLVNEDVWDSDGDVPLRTVTDLDLLEVSAVKNPAYTSSTISARSKKQTDLLDKSKINFRSEGGVRAMELNKFSIEELKSELEKRSAQLKELKTRDAEPTSDNDASEPNNGHLTDQDWKDLLCGCMEMCNIMCESMLGVLPQGSFQQVETDSMPGMDMSKRSNEKRDDATDDSGDNVQTDSAQNPNKAKGDTDHDGIGEERDDGDDVDDSDMETDAKKPAKSEKRDDDDDSGDDSDDSSDSDDSDDSSDDDTETDSKEDPASEKRSLDDMKDVIAKMNDLLKPLD